VSTPESPQDAATPESIPAKTTPTWEMEMLLSGATVFGLLQLPDALHGVTDPLLARLGGGVLLVTNILTLYVGAALYLLLATFIGHLIIRGFWIALLGLRSVFPEGPNFDRLRGGPISRDVARHNAVRAEDEVERLDNLATIVFMFGAMAVVGALMPSLFVLPVLVALWLWPAAPVGLLLMVTFGVFMGPMALAASVDSLFGRHLDRNGRVARSLAAVLVFYQRMTQTRFTNALTTTLMTRLGFGRFMATYMFVLIAVLLGYAMHSVMRRDGIAIGDYDAIPARADSGFAVLPQHYRDQRRDGDRLQRVPFLDSPVLKSDWLRLIVPFNPTRHEAAIAEQCPDVWASLPLSDMPDTGDAADAAANETAHRYLLACYRNLAAIRIDGQPVDVLPDMIVLPDTRLRGLQFMIDARALAPGRHVLQTEKHPNPEKDDAGKKPAPYRIPFWK
jgi:hypothetical protein